MASSVPPPPPVSVSFSPRVETVHEDDDDDDTPPGLQDRARDDDTSDDDDESDVKLMLRLCFDAVLCSAAGSRSTAFPGAVFGSSVFPS